MQLSFDGSKIRKFYSRNCFTAHAVLYALLFFLPGSASPAQEAVSNQNGATDAPQSITLRHTVEDWSDITLENSRLKMAAPDLGEVDQEPGYTRERWRVQWRDMDPIDLYIIKPKGVEKPPVVFYLYSTEMASKRPYINDGWCQRVTSGGFAAVGFVPALSEDRFQMRPMKQWFLSELQEALAETTHDVQMVLKYLEIRNDFDLKHVGVFATGSGATVAVLAAAADLRIDSLDLVNPWADWPVWLKTTPMLSPIERKDYVTPEFFAKVAPLDPVMWLPTLAQQNVRIQIVDSDVVLEKEALAKLEDVAPKNVKVVHYPTQADHKAANTQGRSFQWVKDRLRPPLAAPTESSAQAGPPKSAGNP